MDFNVLNVQYTQRYLLFVAKMIQILTSTEIFIFILADFAFVPVLKLFGQYYLYLIISSRLKSTFADN